MYLYGKPGNFEPLPVLQHSEGGFQNSWSLSKASADVSDPHKKTAPSISKAGTRTKAVLDDLCLGLFISQAAGDPTAVLNMESKAK